MMHRKRSLILSSADIISGNDDLLMEILILLPTKFLIRFKLVSKHWSFLISSRNHTLRHHRPEPQPSLILRDMFSSQFFIFNTAVKRLVPFHFGFPYVKILQSCNGLLLLECKNSRDGPIDCYYYVCNPTTMQYRDLLLRKSFDEIFLAFDPFESPHYQVFLFKNNHPFLLYDSETHTWKESQDFQSERYKCCDGIICLKDCSCFIRSGSSSFYLFQNGVVSPFRSRRIWPRVKKCYMVKSNGNVHCIMIFLHPNSKSFAVGECIDEITNCFLKYHISLNPIAATFSGQRGTAIDMLGMFIGEREEDSIMLFQVPGRIIAYRFLDEIFEVLIDFSLTDLHFVFKFAHPFIPSLVPV